jgi:aldose sugar dehydrogenase
MKIKVVLLALIIITVLTATRCGSSNDIAKQKTAETYAKLCADCHGKNLSDFEKIMWKHGITENEIFQSIAAGIPDLGMPSFKNALSNKEITQLATAYVNALENKNSDILTEKLTSNIFNYNNITIRLDTIATGMDKPWSMVQLPDLSILVTDRNGVLYHVKNKIKTKITNVPEVRAEGQGGLLDIVLHPNYIQNGWIYISFSKPVKENDEDKGTTAIIRAKLNNDELVQIEKIFDAKPAVSTKHHYGCRMVFDKNGKLFFSVGERGRHNEYPQKLDNDNGKIHRINDDGTIPADNPFYNTDKASKSIYTYGNRNPQGIALDEQTGSIWANEHGPKGGDELNWIQPGKNYGWPTISYGINYDGSLLTHKRTQPDMEQPVHYWVPSIAPSGMCFVTGNNYLPWKGNIIINSLKFKYLAKLEMKDNKVINETPILKNVGRIRFVKMGIDNFIYIGIEDDGVVLKLTPVNP